MKSVPVQEITATNFSKFALSNKICVFRAQVGHELGFSKMLKSQLEREFKESVSFGWISTQKLNYQSKAIREFIDVSLPKIGLTTGGAIYPGYYLFKDGILKAYHPATIDLNKIDPHIDGIAALFGVVAGLIVGVSEKNTEKGFEVFFEAMEAPVSFKVFQFFKEILGAKNSSYSQQRHQFVYNEEILNAYKLLQVSPSASDEEITKAWKKLQLKNHPDLHPNDIDAKTKYCIEINNAYDLIKKYRAANA